MKTSFSERLLAIILLILLLPIFAILWLIIKIEDGGPLIFKQKRLGINGEPFIIYKIRTMVPGAENLKKKYQHLNEADGPVFKIYNDPRYTRIGKFLAHTGLDELPQLINIFNGEMKFVGPRPLPPREAKGVPKIYSLRFSVLPGITSLWIIRGSHKLTFRRWMELDVKEVKNKSFKQDIFIALGTIKLILGLLWKRLGKYILGI